MDQAPGRRQYATADRPACLPHCRPQPCKGEAGYDQEDSGGWGWAAFEYDTASHAYTPATTADKPPQGNDAKCGFGCHTIVKSRDYVFTEYGSR
jgi:hypothetical protein